MKKIAFLIALACVFSCQKDDTPSDYVNVAVPLLMSKEQFRNSVEIQSPKQVDQAGKIYAYNNYIFVNNQYKGVQIIDNTNPSSPSAMAYIKIPGNVDISIKDDYLYADSSTDLVVFDISDMNNIKIAARLKDVFSIYDYQIPEGAEYADFGNFNYENDIVVGWDIEKRERSAVNGGGIEIFDALAAQSKSNIGTGGSLARFQIYDNYLYTVTSHEMTIFNISDLAQPSFVSTDYAGNNLETMFETDGYLYLGSTDGMYIYDLENPSSPNFVSEFVHWTGCDPVVVDGDYAYVTIRSGNNCGDQDSVLEVIDVSDKNTPTLLATYSMDNPYGLGVKDDLLFICDGDSGLKVFDKTNPLDLHLEQTFSNLNSIDVIPLTNTLLIIGGNRLVQYEYADGAINLVSTYQLN